jgi:probable phosphoglycerate mutase
VTQVPAGTGRRLIVEADGGSRGNPGPAGFGALVLDADTGDVLAEVAEPLDRATNNVAEYSGLLAGLRAAVAIDPECTVQVRMDSRLVVEQMSGRWQTKHEDMRALARQVRSAIPPDRVTYTWIPRSQNSHADRLANEAMDAAAQGVPWVRKELPRVATATALGSVSGSAPGTAPAVGESSAAPVSTRAPHRPDVGEPATLILVRHGRTAFTEQGRFSGGGGSADPELSAAGQGDAAGVAAALARLGASDSPWPDVRRPDALVSSPLRRTRQTAAAIGAAAGLAAVVDDGWVEAGFGDWDGLTFGEVARKWPDELARWQGSATLEPPGGGESLDAVRARVRATRERTVARFAGRCVLVVTHVTPIRVVVQEALDAGLVALWRLAVAPCSVTIVRFWADGGAEVRTVNATP